MADLPDQQIIPGQIQVLWNHKFVLTIEDLSVEATTSSSVASGFAGNFATRDGIPQYTFSFGMPPLGLGGWEVPLSELKTRGTLTYQWGDQEFNLVGAKVNHEALNVTMQSGNTTTKFSGNALSRSPQ